MECKISHIATIEIQIDSLDALKAACKELGVEFIEGKTTYKWFGGVLGDYPLPKGMTKDTLGKCAHVIRVPGVSYEVGVVRLPDGKYTLAYDFWGIRGNAEHDGHKLKEKFGDQLGVLVQRYAVQRATREAQLKGCRVMRRVQPNGSIRLEISGGHIR